MKAQNLILNNESYPLLQAETNTTGNSGLKLSTGDGYILFGPLNTSHAHLETDRSNFYFNKEIRVDSGVVSSYNEDLYLRRASNSSHQIQIGTTGITNSLKTTFSAGLNGQAILLNGAQNFDNLKDIGFYSLYNVNASGSVNAPFQYGTMISTNSNATGGMGMQLAHERTGAGFYVRGMNDTNDTWYEWDEIWTSGTDGSGSGLDADLLDGYHLSTTRNAANTVPVRNASGYLDLGWINTTSGNTTSNITDIYINTGDNYIRKASKSHFISNLGIWTSGNDGSGSGLDADTVDGKHASDFMADEFLDAAYVDFTVNGNADTYYPVSIRGGGKFAFQMYSIHRGYNWTAPDTWNTATHRGGLTLTWQNSGDGFWGGNDHDIRIIKWDETYSTMVAGMGGSVGGGGTHGGVVVWLRGGGALYRFHGPQATAGDVNIHLSSVTASNGTVFAPRSLNTTTRDNELLPKYPVRNRSDLYDNNNRVWHVGNDGSGSGLDADLLDGQQGSYYAPKASPSFSGTVYTSASQNAWAFRATTGSTSNSSGLWFTGTTARLLLRDSSGTLKTMLAANGTNAENVINGNTIWHAGNDGSSSGLDADLLDGQHGSFYRNAGNLNAGTIPEARLPTQSKYLRSDANDTMSRKLTFSQHSSGAYMQNPGGVTFSSVNANDNSLVLRNLGQFRFEDENNWDYNSWGGLKFDSSADIMYIGGPAASQFTANANPPSIDVDFVGLNSSGLKKDGNVVWHAGNDGSGSGLDADLLDGSQKESFFYDRGTSQIGTGTSWNITAPGMYGVASSSAFTGTNNPGFSGIYTYGVLSVFEANGQGIAQLYTPHTGNKIALRTGWNNGGWYGWQQVWTSTSDGSGSGLDADLLDGQQGSFYRNAANLNSGTLPSARLPSPLNSLHSNAVTGSAFATTSSPSNVLEYQQASGQTDTKLAPSTDWHNTIRMGHGNPYSYYSSTIAVRMTGTGTGDLYTQNIGNNSANGWRKHWSDANDGSGSGLDADLLDGQEGSYYYAASNPNGYTTNTGTVIEGGTTFNGEYPMVVRVSSNNIYSHNSIKFTGSTGTLKTTIVNATSEYKLNNTTIVTSARTLQGVDAATGNTGVRFKTSDWYVDTGYNQRLQFVAGSHNYYKTDGNAGKHFFFDGNSTTEAAADAFIDASGNGHFAGNVTAYSSSVSSDIRLKENIRPIESATETIKQLNGVIFDWKKTERGTDQLGFIAQEVEEVLPSLVTEVQTLKDENTETHKTVNYAALVPMLVESIKELKTEIDNLKIQLKEK